MSEPEGPGAAAPSFGLGRAGVLGLVLLALAATLSPVLLKPNRVAVPLSLSYADLASALPRLGDGKFLRSGLALALLACFLLPLSLLLALVRHDRPGWRSRRGDPRQALLAGAALGAMALVLALGAGTALLNGSSFSASAGPGLVLALVGAWFIVDESLQKGRRGLVPMILAALPGLLFLMLYAPVERIAVLREFLNRRQRFADEALRHLFLVVWPCLVAAALGFSAGIAARHRPRFKTLALALSNGVQVIPSLALFGLLMAPLSALSRAIPALRSAGISGSGAAPALIALGAYATLPMLRNAIAGFDSVPKDALDSGRGMGMDARRLFFSVELPLALPLIVRGLRTAFVQTVGNAAVAALIGAGGLGVFVFQGLGEAAPDLVMLGVLPLLAVATLGDRAFQALEHVARSHAIGERS